MSELLTETGQREKERGIERDTRANHGGGPVSQEGRAAEDPEEVCCHSERCGLFFFWLPLLHAGHVLGCGNHDNPTTLVSHTAEIESE